MPFPTEVEESVEEIENALLAMCGDSSRFTPKSSDNYEMLMTELISYFNVLPTRQREDDDCDHYVSHLTFEDSHFDTLANWLKETYPTVINEITRTTPSMLPMYDISSPEPGNNSYSDERNLVKESENNSSYNDDWVPNIIEGASFLPMKFESTHCSPVKLRRRPTSFDLPSFSLLQSLRDPQRTNSFTPPLPPNLPPTPLPPLPPCNPPLPPQPAQSTSRSPLLPPPLPPALPPLPTMESLFEGFICDNAHRPYSSVAGCSYNDPDQSKSKSEFFRREIKTESRNFEQVQALRNEESVDTKFPISLELVKNEDDQELVIDYEATTTSEEVKVEAGDDGFIPLPDILRDEDDDDDMADIGKYAKTENEIDLPQAENMDFERPPSPENKEVDSAKFATPFGRPLRRGFFNIFDSFFKSASFDGIEEDEDTIAIGQVDDEWQGEPSTSMGSSVKSVGKITLKAKDIVPFISQDESENMDNEDPEWEAMKKIETDDERYKVVRMRWKNLTVPDPNINLTSQKFRMKRTGIAAVRGKRKQVFDGNNKKPKKLRSCTEYFEGEMKKMRDNIHNEQTRLKYEYDMRKARLDNELQDQKRVITRSFSVRRSNANANISMLHADLVRDQTELQEEYSYTSDQLTRIHEKNMKCANRPNYEKLNKLKVVKDEVMAFNSFYSGLKNSSLTKVNRTLLDDDRYNEIKEIENVYAMYDHFYAQPN